MPRPRVKPQDRLRTQKACLPCKRSKVKCDSGTPCGKCESRAIEEQCTYDRTRAARPPPVETVSPTSPHNTNHSTRRRDPEQYFPTHSSADTRSSHDDNADILPEEDSEGPRSRALLSSTLQKVYIGKTASLSYLDFLRGVVREQIGECAFTNNAFSQYMLEKDVVSGGDAAYTDISALDTDALARWCFIATSGILDLHYQADVFSAAQLSNRERTTVSEASLCLILAIGAQCRGSSETDLQTSTALFCKGRTLAFEGMLCDPTLEMISNFLLMAYYLLGACHRNGAFMYLGVASRAASALGLQKADQYRDLSPVDYVARLRHWKSLRVLDTIVCSVLGRHNSPVTTATNETALHPLYELTFRAHELQVVASQAIFDLCPLMDELELQSQIHIAASAERLLQRLRTWRQSLPEEIQQWHGSTFDAINPQDYDKQVGCMHVAGAYYFTVILSSRRFLTAHLLSKVRRRPSNDHSFGKGDPSAEDDHASLGHICIHSAIGLISIGHATLTSCDDINNLCLLKAWTFAAGLILGFAMFLQPDGFDIEVEDAFRKALAIEQRLSELSSQAAHYYEILSSFAEARTLYQRRSVNDRNRAVSRYLGQAFPNEP